MMILFFGLPDEIFSIFNLLKDFLLLVSSVLTFLPTPINKIASFYIAIFIVLFGYKLLRKLLV